jgi:hypothetical protein
MLGVEKRKSQSNKDDNNLPFYLILVRFNDYNCGTPGILFRYFELAQLIGGKSRPE